MAHLKLLFIVENRRISLPADPTPLHHVRPLLSIACVDTCGGTQRQNLQAHGYRSSFHLEYYRVSSIGKRVCCLNSSLSRDSNQRISMSREDSNGYDPMQSKAYDSSVHFGTPLRR